MVSDLNPALREDLEAQFRLGGLGGVETAVDLTSDGLRVEGLPVDEGTIADVEVEVRQGHRQQTGYK